MRKRIFMSAALAIFGCAGADAGGTDVPPFAFSSGPQDTAGVQPGSDPAATPEGSASAASTPTPVNEEGQNANNLPIAPTNGGGGGAAPPAAAPSAAATPPQATNGMAAGMGQGANGMMPAPAPRALLDCAAAAPALTGGTMSCSSNASGAVGDQRWYMWSSGTGGCITRYDGGAFKATWNNSGDFLARMGLQFDETKTFDQYGTIGADLSFTKTGSAGNYSFIGIYGWSNNPLVEYYVVENSFQNGPQTPYATTQKGTFNLDGADYKVYAGTKTNQPSIHGTATFQQFFSVRQTPRQCGHISISEHFKKWAGMGMPLGKMSEARVLVEAGGGSGSINFTTAYVSAGGG